MDRRLYLLLAAALLIVGLCAWRATRPTRPVVMPVTTGPRALPPRGWELPDHQFHLVKFDRYLGRQPVILWFSDAQTPPESDEVILWLRDHFDALHARGYEVLAITLARPVEVRQTAERLGRPWPFPVLSDMQERNPAPAPVHYLWSRVDRMTGALLPGLFVIDRMGYIEYADGRPRPADDVWTTLKSLTGE